MSRPTNRRFVDDYYAERLAEPWLLDKAVLLDLEASQAPLAVPVGKLRRGGHIEFLDKREATRALKLLTGRDGFPNLRIGKGCTVRWGDPVPFCGCDYCDPICSMILGLYYGYKPEVIAEHFEQYINFSRTQLPRTRKQIMRLISAAAHPE